MKKPRKISTERGTITMRNKKGIGDSFAESIIADIIALRRLSGVHSQHFGFFRMLGSHFRFGIYYREHGEETLVGAVLDLRRNPAWIRKQLHRRKTPNE